MKVCSSAYFITLTYDTANIPITKQGRLSLCKRDVQTFLKRLRKRHKNNAHKSIKYYLVGEYGSKTKRPHYHVILYNAELNHIAPAWGNGEVYFGTVTDNSIGYCFKYMCKLNKIGYSRKDDRQKEFALMSKGLGKNYVTPQMIRWHNAEIGRMYCNIPGGKKVSMPRYYKDKIYDLKTRHLNAEYVKLRNEHAESIRNKNIDIFKDYIQKQQSITAAYRREFVLSLKQSKL